MPGAAVRRRRPPYACSPRRTPHQSCLGLPPTGANRAGAERRLFGSENTVVHIIATNVDLKEYATALTDGERYLRAYTLPATRIGPLHMNLARARLALKDRDGALDSLEEAWHVAPQMSKVHPTSLELSRVLVSLHKRSNPKVTALAKRAGIPLRP